MLRTTTRWDGLPGTPYFTVLHFGGTTEEHAEASHAATAAIFNAINTQRAQAMTGQVLTEVEVIDPATGNVTTTYTVPPVALQTGVTGARQPTVIQGLVQLRTGVYDAGRELRGRIFLPGMIDSTDNDGKPSTTFQTGIAQGFNDMIQDTAALGTPLGVYSPTKGTFAPASQASVWSEWAVLRSRRE